MSFITLGLSTELQIVVPTNGTRNWGDTMKTDTFQKIAEHDHTGSGKGKQIGTGAIVADAVTGAKVRLDNNEALRSRNAADSANIDIIKIGTTDEIELGAPFKNNTYITARNQADTANLNIWKIDGGDDLDFGTDISRLFMKNDVYIKATDNAGTGSVDIAKVDSSDNVQIKAHTILQQSSVTLADNQSAITAGIITLASDESAKIEYRIVRSTDVQKGELSISESGDLLFDEYIGTDCGVTFSLNAGDLEYATTSTGNTATLTYVIIKQ